MKIIQINSVCGQGSTGRIAMDISIESEKYGHTNLIAYGHGTSAYHHSHKIGNKFDHLFHNIMFSRLLGLQGFGSIINTIRLTKWIDKHKPDIVHLHNLHANYVNTYILFRFLAKRNFPIVFTLHDCYNFTGKCTYFTSAECYRWKTECYHCPLKKRSGMPSIIFDWSRMIFKMKKALYGDIKSCYSVAVSKWLKGIADHSILHEYGHNVTYIYNWIDYDTFKPSSLDEIEECKNKYHLDKQQKYIISVSQEWQENSTRFTDAILLAHLLPQEYNLVLVGSVRSKTGIPKGIIHIPYVTSQKELATLYSLAEAYVHFSIQDTFGLVIGEAMACGTIPITYDSTACAETPGSYGIVVPPRDVQAIAQSLPLLTEKKKHCSEMIGYVKANYDKVSNIKQYLKLYELLSKDNQVRG